MSFQCPLCPIIEDSITLLQVHCMSIHTRDFVSCPWCTLPFSNPRVLQKHATRCQQFDENGSREGNIKAVYIQDNRCAPCESQFVSNEAAIKHYKEHHLNYRYVCEHCERCFEVYKNLERHYADGHPRASTSAGDSRPSPSMAMPNSKRHVDGGQAFPMPSTSAKAFAWRASSSMAMPPPSTNASAATSSSVSNQAHASNSHPRRKKILSQLSRKEWYLYRHAFRVRICHDCQVSFGSIEDIMRHFESDHNTKIFPCPMCNNMYRSYGSWHGHKCARNLRSMAEANRRPLVDNNTGSHEILRCPVELCGFRTTIKHQLTTHTRQNAHFPQDVAMNWQDDAAGHIPVNLIKTESTDHVRERPAFRQMRETRGMNASGSEVINLISDSESDENNENL